ncbi:MAG: hypothetical protein ACI92O_001033 [Colwellia sp.]|jgi:heme A synthase
MKVAKHNSLGRQFISNSQANMQISHRMGFYIVFFIIDVVYDDAVVLNS